MKPAMSTSILALVVLFVTWQSALGTASPCSVRFVPVLNFSELYIHGLWQCRGFLAFKNVDLLPGIGV